MQNKQMTEVEKQKLLEMIEREKVERKSRVKKLDLPLFAFIFSILPIAMLLTALVPFLGIVFFFGIALFPYLALSLGAVGILLAITSLAKREPRGRNLAIAAIIFGVLEILAGLYFRRISWWSNGW